MPESMVHAPALQTAEPWGFPVDAYERDHQRVVLDSLLKGAYERAFEAGCGSGDLTEQLAKCCRRLIASDIAPTAVARARIRLDSMSHVSVRCADLLEHLPDGPFDLIVLREIGHPMKPPEVLKVSLALAERLTSGGELVVLHGVARRAGASMAGECIHNLLSCTLPLEWVKRERGVGYRLDSWRKN